LDNAEGAAHPVRMSADPIRINRAPVLTLLAAVVAAERSTHAIPDRALQPLPPLGRLRRVDSAAASCIPQAVNNRSRS